MKSKEMADLELRVRNAELEMLIKRTDVLFSIAEAGIKSTNLFELLNLIVENIVQGTSANRVSMITLDLAGKKINHFARGGPGAQNIELAVSYEELMEGLSGWTIQNKQSALSPKDKPDPRESVAVQQRRRATNCGSIIVTPVQHHDEILGTITVINDPTDRDFTARDVLLIEAAAGQAATAIVKASLYQELELANRSLKEYSHELEREIAERKQMESEITERANQLTALNQLSRNVVSTFDLDEIYRFAHQTVEQLMPIDAFYISLVNEQENVIEDAYLFDAGKRYPNERASLSIQSITTQVINNGQPLLIKDDADGSSKVLGTTIYGTPADTRSVLIVPIIGNNKVLGVISAQHYQPNMYTPTHQQLLELLANQVAIAIFNARLHTAVQQEAIRDPLTGLFNRRFMEEALEKEILRAKRNSLPLAIALIDIDHFKQTNDRFGHDAGDLVLRFLAKLIGEKVRGSDIACRYGGEELALILPGASIESAFQRMDQLRQDIKFFSFNYQEQTLIQLTCSIGVAVYPRHGTVSADLLKAADKALYRAKENGRDQVLKAE